MAVLNWRDLGHSLAGGSERYAWEAARALREAGAQVEFVTAREPGDRPVERVEGITVRRRGGQFTYYFWVVWYLLTRRRRLDVVIDPECGIPSFSPLFLQRRTAVVLVVHHVHLRQFDAYFPRPLALLGKFLEGWLMPRVYRGTRTVAVSDSTRHEMQDLLGFRGEIGILANGASVPDDEGVRVEDKDIDRVLVLGRLVPHKRVGLVVRAIHELAQERPGLHLDICGRGPEEASLRSLIAELGLEDRVTLHGFLPEEEKEALLRRSVLHVCASDLEGWGQVVVEAAGYGVPTVARDVPGLRDSIRDGETGWLVPDVPGDLDSVSTRLTEQLRATLAELEQFEVRAQTFKACREWASTFSWQRMRGEIRQLVDEEVGLRR
ncbi:glycosyltransferase family 4 protein [Nocardioides pacificus]